MRSNIKFIHIKKSNLSGTTIEVLKMYNNNFLIFKI